MCTEILLTPLIDAGPAEVMAPPRVDAWAATKALDDQAEALRSGE
jgi:hypothetical protein